MTGNADASLSQVSVRSSDAPPHLAVAESSVATATRSLEHPRDWTRTYLRRAIAADVICAVLADLVAILGSGAIPLRDPIPTPYLVILLAGPVVWVLTVAACHGYERRFLGVGMDEYRALPSAAIRLLALSTFISYAIYIDRPYLSRYFVLIYFPVLLGSALLARYGVRQSLHRSRWQGRNLSRAVVVGRSDAVQGLVRDLQREPVHGIRPVAACTSGSLSPDCSVTSAGSVHDVLQTVERYDADVVVVASPSELSGVELRRLSWDLDDLGIELVVAPGIMEVTGPRLSIRPAANLSLLHIERPALHGVNAFSKATFDRTIAIVWCVLMIPLFATIGLLIKLDSKGPVFFRQSRVGLDGQGFSIVKFRSMVVDAEAKLAEVRSESDDGNGVLYKRHDDPRITRIGRVLRRFSLDELPQLINVARGEMSLVGPRPPLQSEVDGYEADAIRRLKVRPGLTGLWQVSGRSDLSWDESLRLDLRYVDNWSMMFDIQILWRTIRAVLRGTGAY
ncbi:sugar transferase [Leekyejoonella antrihumi]|uniref:Sugar transferase n=1 Tax=Leekyejoonella antrihumi TaxID=1660198 RepID=A0A563E7W9_9MICO|nr:sugar transferase [Leekyejoonella antrihumi]TWP38678.1 sugar transferase [Leekyejoonella antrihumi]